MPNLISLNIVYDSSGLLTGLNDIDLMCTASSENKQISSAVYDISVSPPLKVSNPVDSNTKILTKIEDCNGSYYLVSDSYGKVSDVMTSNCEFCQIEPPAEEEETDPIFSVSPANEITEDHITFLDSKDYNSLNNKPDLTLKADLLGGKVPASQLPSYVDDVIEGANLAALNALPAIEKISGKIYVTLDTNKTYRWSGSAFVEISSSGYVPTLYPKVDIIDYVTTDATNYILRVRVSNVTSLSFSGPNYFSVSCNGFNPVNAVGVSVTIDTGSGYAVTPNPEGGFIGGFANCIITFPKATNTSPVWSNSLVAISVTWLGTDNNDGGVNSIYKPRRIGNDTKVIGQCGIKTLNSQSLLGAGNIVINTPAAQFGTTYTKEWNGSVTTTTDTAVFNIASAAFASISSISLATELNGATINNAPIGAITARSLTSITISLYESKNTAVLVGGNIDGLEAHSAPNTIVHLTVKGN